MRGEHTFSLGSSQPSAASFSAIIGMVLRPFLTVAQRVNCKSCNSRMDQIHVNFSEVKDIHRERSFPQTEFRWLRSLKRC